MSKNDIESEIICKYCLDSIDIELEYFNPCECKNLVHKDCLIKWLEKRPLNCNINICEICKTEYNFSIDKNIILMREKKIAGKNCTNLKMTISIIFCLFFFISICYVSFSSEIYDYSNSNYNYTNTSEYRELYSEIKEFPIEYYLNNN